MAQFKLVQRSITYEHCWVEAESREQAKEFWENGEISHNWQFDDSMECVLIAVDEGDITNDVENGKFVDEDEPVTDEERSNGPGKKGGE